MPRLIRAVRFGALNSLALCLALTTLRGVRDGWDSIRINNPPTPEVGFFLLLAAIQTVAGRLLISPNHSEAKSPIRDL